MRISFNAAAGDIFSSGTLGLVHDTFKNLSSKQARIKLKIEFLEEVLQINLL
jgi:hypothetical protein